MRRCVASCSKWFGTCPCLERKSPCWGYTRMGRKRDLKNVHPKRPPAMSADDPHLAVHDEPALPLLKPDVRHAHERERGHAADPFS